MYVYKNFIRKVHIYKVFYLLQKRVSNVGCAEFHALASLVTIQHSYVLAACCSDNVGVTVHCVCRSFK